MTLQAISTILGDGGVGVNDQLGAAVKELQGMQVSAVAGAAANTKMNIAAMRTEDTILAALLQGGVTTVGVAEVQHIAVDATSGNFTITWSGQTTANIAYNASAATVQAALEALSNIAVGDVVVTGGPGSSGGGTPYILTWSVYLGNVAQPTCTSVSLAGGGASVTPSTTTAGVQQVGGTFSDDAANITIQSTKASGTITFSGVPAADGTVTVNGNVYVFKASPTSLLHVDLKGTASLQGDEMARAINAYETRYTGSHNNVAAVVATSNGSGVVTVTSVVDGAGNQPAVTGTVTTLAETATNPNAPYVTCASVVADNTVTVNGVVFTAKAEPDAEDEFDVELTDALQAAEIARVVNLYVFGNSGSPDILATPSGATVIFTPIKPLAGNAIVLSESATNTAVSGSGYLAGGTATGGIKSTTDLTGESLLVYWYNKR